MPEISVVMSVYNLSEGQILTKSITSVLNQDFKDLELLICDDGSTDGKIGRASCRERVSA